MPKKFSPVLLYSEDAKQIHEALVSSGHHELALKIAAKAKRTKMDRRYADAAQSLEPGAFDVDDDPVVSRGEDGAFVMVWHWVYKSDLPKKTNEVV